MTTKTDRVAGVPVSGKEGEKVLMGAARRGMGIVGIRWVKLSLSFDIVLGFCSDAL